MVGGPGSGKLVETGTVLPSSRSCRCRLTGEWDGHAEDEHICLRLARACGLVVPNSSVRRFGGEVAIVIERYDRVYNSGQRIRVHQEDMCQAFAINPARKYENDGGPGVRRITDLLRQYSSHAGEDVQTFLDAIAFNWLIAGTDGHAKNYALLLGGQGAAAKYRFAALAKASRGSARGR